MDTELVDKHHEMRKLRKQIKDVVIELKSLLSLVLLHSAIHQVGIAVKSKIKCIKSKTFFIIFKGFSVPKVVPDLRVLL